MIMLMEIQVQEVPSKKNLTYMFTKSLPRSRLKNCLDLIKFVEECFKFWIEISKLLSHQIDIIVDLMSM